VTLIDEPLPQSPKKLAINKTESQPPSKDKRPTPPPPPSSEVVMRCSVIQRNPAATATCTTERGNKDESDIKLPVSMLLNQQHVEPEQDQPIDYHIPKRKEAGRGDEEEDKGRKLREVSGIFGSIIPVLRFDCAFVLCLFEIRLVVNAVQ
jgi:ovo